MATLPGVLFNSSALTRNGRREVERRARILESFELLNQKGLSQAEAARELRVSITTLWRYRKRIEPLTANCGRKSALERLDPPARVLRAVRQLQLGGKSNAGAWRAMADDARCPKKLAEYIRSTGNISRSLLNATKLIRRKATLIEGPEFTVIRA